ncbi:MAG: putative DNA-binding domain-containing protein [Rhizobacter sp.]|nr:putative DNA-binding domain-containing protein [Rhizobacter sp.]
MNTLAQQQHQLLAAIVDAAPAEGMLRGREPSLLRIYQHAYAARLLGALRDNHGVLPRAMGDEAFDALALAYLQAHPSRQPSIRWFGDRLAQFMATRDDLVPHPALIDLARMEWALRTAFDAADAASLSAAALAQLPSPAWPELVLRLHPSVQLLALGWRIEPAWRALQSGGDDEPELPEPQPGLHTLLVWRAGLETRWRSAASELEATLLAALMRGEPFAALCGHAAQSVGAGEAAVRVVGALHQWLAEGLLVE